MDANVRPDPVAPTLKNNVTGLDFSKINEHVN